MTCAFLCEQLAQLHTVLKVKVKIHNLVATFLVQLELELLLYVLKEPDEVALGVSEINKKF